MQLWIDKYKPKGLVEFVGNKKVVEQLRGWISSFKQGKAVLLYGSPGIGKSLLVEALAAENDLLLMQLNADDISSESMQGLIRSSKNRTIFNKGKIILVDEVEGISGRDRGVMGLVVELIKQSRFPVFLIASDPYLDKLRTVKEYCELVKFDKIPSPSIGKRLGEICAEEGIEADKDVLDTLAKFCQGDLRSAITDLQIVCLGKNKIAQEDLQALGFREKEQSVFNILQPIFHSRSLSVGRNSMQQADKDPDEVFWWIENNLTAELKTPEEIANGYNLLSAADILRNRTMKQQNWRFKAISSDLISGISVLKKSHTGFVMYKPPQRLIQLGRTKAKRAEREALCEEIGTQVHCSKKIVKNQYLPYLRFFK